MLASIKKIHFLPASYTEFYFMNNDVTNPVTFIRFTSTVGPLSKVAKVLNHSNTTSTLRYLGITQAEVLQTYDDYEL